MFKVSGWVLPPPPQEKNCLRHFYILNVKILCYRAGFRVLEPQGNSTNSNCCQGKQIKFFPWLILGWGSKIISFHTDIYTYIYKYFFFYEFSVLNIFLKSQNSKIVDYRNLNKLLSTVKRFWCIRLKKKKNKKRLAFVSFRNNFFLHLTSFY